MCHVTSMLTLVAFAMISSPCDATDVKICDKFIRQASRPCRRPQTFADDESKISFAKSPCTTAKTQITVKL